MKLIRFGACVGLAMWNVLAPAGAQPIAPPRDAEARKLLQSGQFEAARLKYSAEVARSPRDLEARLGLLLSLRRLDRWQESLDAAQSATADFPRSASVQGLLSLAQMRAAQPDKAAASSKLALSLDGREKWALLSAGRVARWNGDDLAERQFYKRAAQAAPNDAEGWLGVAGSLGRDTPLLERRDTSRKLLRLHAQGYPFSAQAPDSVLRRQAALSAQDPLERADTSKSYDLQFIAPKPGASDGWSTTVRLERYQGLLLVPVQVKGQTLRLMLDTGAQGITLSGAAARRLKVVGLSSSLVRGIGGDQAISVAPLAGLSIGGLRFGATRADVMESKTFMLTAPSDGILGAGALLGWKITIDNKKLTLTLSHPLPHGQALSSAAPAPAPQDAAAPASEPAGIHQIVSFRFQVAPSGQILAPTVSDGKAHWTLFDTGANITVLSLGLANQLARGLPAKSVERRQEKKMSAMGFGQTAPEASWVVFEKEFVVQVGHEASPFSFAPNKGIGGSFMDQQISPALDFEVGMLVGMNMLASFDRVTFDYPNRLATIEYTEQAAKPAAAPAK